ncbi:MAG: response regulator [Microcoleus sp. PH2017_10_PVI_O_A]|uniref:response regulator n=2 Tax=Microcoleus TaxID=44471 RepID=UPI001D52B859|nr:response regulator [Microcoleus sp. PH2017_27_LUM_O_A]MCC3409020.1 response regulator [Microcoleus sp. PH2017_10_PVI_O_A]MCC3463125.1 response regulator [Microcoleus sp. PH2017_11_PCY_U_A]MCC3481540.1 response regulator [Microcoleus sp. PH2017_12_PCY_D_A]MCC3530007.1 response regulator [Microcoleus sp. PH2017_21_RUC_O_A]MCC3540158.1 response regulator [Microcoleus sp. PH2017_22_RUC_O_B]TAE81927.1 MAG: response regulator [Oscillatoriales cyanobacterium]
MRVDMSATAIGYKMLSHTLAVLSQKQATGKLLLEQGEQQWQLYFFQGSLVYATGGSHRARRWYRAVGQHCRNFQVDLRDIEARELWEYQLIQQGLAASEMSLQQAKAIVHSSISEVFFALIGQSGLRREWRPSEKYFSKIISSLLLSVTEVDQILCSTEQIWNKWKGMGLWLVEPEQAPLLKASAQLQENRFSSNSLIALANVFNGENTLWDIALKKKQCVTVATRALVNYMKQGLVNFRTVPDLPSPIEQWRLAASMAGQVRPLIACIDDSPTVCEFLQEILLPAGYRVLKIQDPMDGVGIIAKQKPALIFMDVVMPKTSGFALCNFLRKTPSFRETPIVFLTGQDSIIDRTRAKLTGASDFLSKPPNPEQVLQIAQKYLKVKGDRSPLGIRHHDLLSSRQLSLANS